MPSSNALVAAVGSIALAYGLASPKSLVESPSADERLLEILRKDTSYSSVPDAVFDELGWELPDKGLEAQRLAARAPGGALDPQTLAYLPSHVGYRVKWHVVRYTYYGVPWDISGVYLEPNTRVRGLPTLVLIAGSASNWYTFFVDPSHHPGIAQYLAQRIPVLLVTLPGSYRRGGWWEPPERRKPRYELDRELGGEEIRARNAVFTFRLVAEGILRLLDQATEGPLLIAGHGAASQVAFLLEERLGSRSRGLLLGWSTGGPASLSRLWAHGSRERRAPSVTELRPLGPETLADGIGPLHPLLPDKSGDVSRWRTRLENEPALASTVARRYLEAESHRQPFFEPTLQILEEAGRTALREEMAAEIRGVALRTGVPANPNEVIIDLFSTVRAPLTGYRRMVWMAGSLDGTMWNPDPEQARLLSVADAFRERNPEAQIRAVVFETALTSLAHLEKPRQLAGALLAAVRWLEAERPSPITPPGATQALADEEEKTARVTDRR